MSPEQGKKPDIRETLASRLDKPRSTGDLLRTAKQVLKLNPKFAEQTATSAVLHLPWIFFQYNENTYLMRLDHVETEEMGEKKIKEILLLYRNLPGNQAECIRIETDGLNSEQKWDGKKWIDEEVGGPQFGGLSYAIDQDFSGEKLVDEETQETSYIVNRQPPIVGKDALPHAQRIFKELLQEEKLETQ